MEGGGKILYRILLKDPKGQCGISRVTLSLFYGILLPLRGAQKSANVSPLVPDEEEKTT